MICLIGNSGYKHNSLDGQTSKVRLYYKKMLDEGLDVIFIDLENPIINLLKILIRIKRAFKRSNRIVLLTSTRGCKILIPYINYLNRKVKKTFVLPLIGSSVLNYTIKKMKEKELKKFLREINLEIAHASRFWVKNLNKIDYILPETDNLTFIFSKFYKLKNCITLNNFREDISTKSKETVSKPIKLIYLSRVMEKKGIFDLINVINELNKKEQYFVLDIYGKLSLNKKEKKIFSKLCNNENVFYKGVVQQEAVIKTIAEYDLFVFPTKFYQEGTPGVLAESFLAGVPVLSSNFPQATLMLKNECDSFIYDFCNNDDLKNKLLYVIENPNTLYKMKKNCKVSANVFSYAYSRNVFLEIVCGENNNK